MATAYSESTLAQLYKTHGPEGIYRGGPAFYIARGLGLPWLGAIFSVCLILSFGLVFNAVQANSIADAMVGAFGIPKLVTGLVLAALTAVVIFGGIRKIATVAEYRRALHGRRLPAGGDLRARDQPPPRCRACSRTSSARPSASRKRSAASPAASPRPC